MTTRLASLTLRTGIAVRRSSRSPEIGAPKVLHHCASCALWCGVATRDTVCGPGGEVSPGEVPEVTRFPGSSRAWVGTLKTGSPPPEAGLVWCDRDATRIYEWREQGRDSSARPEPADRQVVKSGASR